MKKTIVLLLFVVLFYSFVSSAFSSGVLIPDDAIRIRVVPNSNSSYDQNVKLKVKDELEDVMYDLLKDASDSTEARGIIVDNLDSISSSVGNVLEREKYDKNYEVNFGYNYFPEKEYKGVSYEEGYYESLLVKLGEGEGDNWWCVLFPPLCLIEASDSDDVEYKSLVKEVLSRYL